MSFTTIAVASAAAPAVDDVATTWATSWTLAPTQAPNCSSSSPSGRLERRQRDDRERAAEGHECDGERDLVLVRVDDAVRSRDRRDAADREAGGDEEREIVGDAEPATGPAGAEERDRHDRDDDEQRAEAEREDVGEDEVEPEQDDAELEHRPGGDLQAGRGRRRDAREVRERACRARRRARAAAGPGTARWAAERDRNPDPRESEARRCARHSSGCRNG